MGSGFVAPPISDGVDFDRYQLLLSIGRSLAMRTASRTVVKALADGRSPLLKHLLGDGDAPFQLSHEVADLGDAALTSLSHAIGVGVSGLHMQSMGYVWRANGRELLPAGGRIPDYIWDTGVPGTGVVASEAKGATSTRADFDAVDARARDGFFGQVVPRVGETTFDGDLIVAGYAFGVFAAGGEEARTAVYETMGPYGGTVGPTGRHAVDLGPAVSLRRGDAPARDRRRAGLRRPDGRARDIRRLWRRTPVVRRTRTRAVPDAQGGPVRSHERACAIAQSGGPRPQSVDRLRRCFRGGQGSLAALCGQAGPPAARRPRARSGWTRASHSLRSSRREPEVETGQRLF